MCQIIIISLKGNVALSCLNYCVLTGLIEGLGKWECGNEISLSSARLHVTVMCAGYCGLLLAFYSIFSCIKKFMPPQ